MMRTEKDVVRIWAANEALLRDRIHPVVIEPLSRPPGLRTQTDWDYILATYLGRCFDTFRAIQVLCNPNAEANLWIDAYILSRSIFEIDITLRWCEIKPENLQRFLDDYHLKVARVFEARSDLQKSQVTRERQAQIQEREAIVLQKYNRGLGARSVMVGFEQICRELSDGESEPNILWEYDEYYREVSSFAHPSMWHLFSYRSQLSPNTEVTPKGYRALLVSAGCFLRILGRWIGIFNACRFPNRTSGFQNGLH